MTFPDGFRVEDHGGSSNFNSGTQCRRYLGTVSRQPSGLSSRRPSRRPQSGVWWRHNVTWLRVGITIPAERLRRVLEQALTLAESDVELPSIWVDRVNRIGESPSKTYVAALGTALAKATDPSVDALTIKSKAGANAYSMRGVAKVLVEGASRYGFHLGRTGPEPLNNQPWFGVDRVDKIDNLKADALPYHRDSSRRLALAPPRRLEVAPPAVGFLCCSFYIG